MQSQVFPAAFCICTKPRHNSCFEKLHSSEQMASYKLFLITETVKISTFMGTYIFILFPTLYRRNFS